MTIDISANNPRISYSVAAGVTQTSFAVPFEFFDDSDLNVYIDTTLQTITTNYTVTGGAGSTGTVTMSVTGPKTVIFTRDTTIERTTDFTAGVDINRAALNTQLDTLTAISADNKDLGERSIRITDYDPAASNLLLPDAATRADKLLSFDTEGDISVQSASDLLTGSILGANYTKASYTGNGTQTAYSTVESAGSKNNIQVYVDGVYQNKDTFSISGSTLTFTEAPPLNSAIEFIVGNAVTSITGDASAITYDQGGTGAQERTVKSKLQETVSVKDFGAVGDGVADDYLAIQAAVDSGAKRIYFPAGTYYASQKITLAHTGSYYRRDTGQVFYGDGIYTILTRNQVAVTQGATEVDWNNNAFFSVYGSYNEFEQLQFRHCPIAIYYGQDPAQIGIEQSQTAFNKMRNLLIQDCGTGILSAVSKGHYYNQYEGIHIVESQIGIYFTVHSEWPTPSVSNNNRNTFFNIRASRCQVGFWLDNGGTNNIYSFHCENCGASPTNNPFSSPSGLPGGITTAAFIITANNNQFYGCVHESCDLYIYHDALFTQSFGNLFRIDNEPSAQNFVTPFETHFDRSTTWIGDGSFVRLSNTNTAFPDAPAGFAVTQAPKGSYHIGDRTQVEAYSTEDEGYEAEYIKVLGAVASGGTVSFTLWDEVTAQTSASSYFEVTVVGNSQTDSFVYANTFKVIALRIASRTLTRYYLYEQEDARAIGANSGDSTDKITPSLSVTDKDLILTFTMPSRTFESVSATVKQLYTKA
jgi:hypothetical protein